MRGFVSMIGLFVLFGLLLPLVAVADEVIPGTGVWPGLFSFVMTNLPALLGAATSIVGGFAILAAMTPNTSDDKIVDFILKLVNFLGFNVGKARNDPAQK